MSITEENLSFNTMDAFNEWKKQYESTTRSCYILKCDPYLSNDTKTYYYYCNRGGIYKPRGNQIRQLKSQGTTKIGSQCSAYIKATCNLRTQEVYVQYCRTHYNHSTTLAFLKIPENIRLDIASKLQGPP